MCVFVFLSIRVFVLVCVCICLFYGSSPNVSYFPLGYFAVITKSFFVLYAILCYNWHLIIFMYLIIIIMHIYTLDDLIHYCILYVYTVGDLIHCCILYVYTLDEPIDH